MNPFRVGQWVHWGNSLVLHVVLSERPMERGGLACILLGNSEGIVWAPVERCSASLEARSAPVPTLAGKIT